MRQLLEAHYQDAMSAMVVTDNHEALLRLQGEARNLRRMIGMLDRATVEQEVN